MTSKRGKAVFGVPKIATNPINRIDGFVSTPTQSNSRQDVIEAPMTKKEDDSNALPSEREVCLADEIHQPNKQGRGYDEFFKKNDIKTNRHIYVSEDIHKKLSLLKALGNISINNYIHNIIVAHFEDYNPDIQQIIDQIKR